MSDFIEVAATQEADVPEVGNELQILADLAPTFTFASHQNSIPVVRWIRIENTMDKSLDDLRLELTASPPFILGIPFEPDDAPNVMLGRSQRL